MFSMCVIVGQHSHSTASADFDGLSGSIATGYGMVIAEDDLHCVYSLFSCVLINASVDVLLSALSFQTVAVTSL